MFQTIIKILGGTSIAAGSILIGNHYYVHSNWKSSHPLIQEAISFLPKDPKVLKELGPDLVKKGGVSGVLEPEKKWASASFKVRGLTDATVNIVADAKAIEDIHDEYYPIGPYKPPNTTIDYIYELFFGKTEAGPEYKWKIVSLSVQFDELFAMNVIGEGGRSHKQLAECSGVVEDEESQTESVGMQRRKNVFKSISKVYWKMVIAGALVSACALYVNRTLKHYPMKNSLFINKALDIMRTDEVVRTQLGMPLQAVQSFEGFLSYNKSSGRAQMFIYGPNGSARANVKGSFDKKSKTWTYQEILIRKDNKEYSVLTKE